MARNSFHPTFCRAAVVAVAAASVFRPGIAASQSGPTPTTRMIDMGGYKLRVRSAGLAVAGRPVVVFESGLGTPLDNWDVVQRDVARDAATFAYDRAGIGGSEQGREAPALPHIVAELHALLAKTGTRPPYVLVGHSMGGPAIRLFASRYPTEVAGLVYVDPTDFTMSVADQEAIWRELKVPDGVAVWHRFMTSLYSQATVPPGVRAEADALGPVVDAGFPDFQQIAPAPDVPTVILLAGQEQPIRSLPSGVQFPGGNPTAWFETTLKMRVEHMARVARSSAEGTLVLTPNSSHYIQATEPDLVAWGVRRALRPDLGRRLALAAKIAGGDSAVRLYGALKKEYPASSFNQGLLNSLGYVLLGQNKLEDAIIVFRRNVAEYPRDANPYDSLGEAYMAHGDRALAIQNYERSLALDPHNTNATTRLAKLRAP